MKDAATNIVFNITTSVSSFVAVYDAGNSSIGTILSVASVEIIDVTIIIRIAEKLKVCLTL